MIAHKFLRRGGRALFTDLSWPLPAAGEQSPWLEAAPGPLLPCRNGLHACRPDDLAFWISDELWEIELGDERIVASDALVARRARLVRRVARWSADAPAQFSHGCIVRASSACARAATSPDHPAMQYLQQAEGFARDGNHTVAAYAAALVLGALVATTDRMDAFRAERREQGRLLATTVGI